MLSYRIFASRHDVSEHVIREFSANSEREAKAEFELVKTRPDNIWNDLRLVEYTEKLISVSWASERNPNPSIIDR